MALPEQHYAALKADIDANTNTVNWQGAPVAIKDMPNTSDANYEIATWYNQQATPAFWSYRRSLSKREVTEQPGLDTDGVTVTNFDWASPGGYIARTQGERDAWKEIFSGEMCNPSLANVRSGFDNIFSGVQQGSLNNRKHLAAKSRRETNRIEKLLAVGTGSTADPSVLKYEGTITYSDVDSARGHSTTMAAAAEAPAAPATKGPAAKTAARK